MATTLKQVAVDTTSHNYTSLIGDAANALEVWGDTTANTIVLTNNTADGTTIHGLGGNDTITVGTGKETIVYNAGEGNDTITNFDTTKDTISFANVNASQLSFSLTAGGDVVVTLDANNSVTLHNSVAVTDLNTFVNDFVTSDSGKFVFATSNANGTVDAGGTTATATGVTVVGLDGNDTIEYFGSEKFVDGGKGTNVVKDDKATSGLTVDLSDTTKFKNVENAIGGSVFNDIVRGDANANDLDYTASTGNNLIWGKGGNDTIDGGVGNDTFYFGTGDGTDNVYLFGAGGANTVNGKDTVNLYNVNASDVTFTTSGTTLKITFKDNYTDALIIDDWSSAANVTFVTKDNPNGFKVAAGNTIYDSSILKYIGDSSTVITTDGKGDTISLYDTTKYTGIVKVTSAATNTAGDILRGVGGTATSVLDASLNANGNQLWGGVGGNDTLIGGKGADTFYYGTANGNDTVTLGGGKDVVNLYNVNAADVKFAKDSGNGLKVTFNNDYTDQLDITDYTTTTGAVTFATKDNAAFTVVEGNGALKYDSKAAFYVGTGVANTLDASTQTAAVTVTLADATKYSTIQNVTGGTGNDILRGIATGSVLIGGAGSDQLWGGKGATNSTLTGGTVVAGVATDDGAADTYFFGAGDGTVTVNGYGKEDTVDLYNVKTSDLKLTNNGTDLTVKINGDATDTLTVAGYDTASVVSPTFVTADNATGFDVVAAKSTTSSVAYDANALAYVAVTGATAGTGDVIDASKQTAGVTIDLSNSTKYQGIENVIGGQGSDILRGNKDNNILDAHNSTTGAQLWGGAGNDTLIGGTGADTFYFGIGDGTDTITQTDKTDKVMLYTTGLDSAAVAITATVGATTSLALTLGTGSILNISDWNAATTFVLGTTQTADDTYKVSSVQGKYQLVKAS